MTLSGRARPQHSNLTIVCMVLVYIIGTDHTRCRLTSARSWLAFARAMSNLFQIAEVFDLSLEPCNYQERSQVLLRAYLAVHGAFLAKADSTRAENTCQSAPKRSGVTFENKRF